MRGACAPSGAVSVGGSTVEGKATRRSRRPRRGPPCGGRRSDARTERGCCATRLARCMRCTHASSYRTCSGESVESGSSRNGQGRTEFNNRIHRHLRVLVAEAEVTRAGLSDPIGRKIRTGLSVYLGLPPCVLLQLTSDRCSAGLQISRCAVTQDSSRSCEECQGTWALCQAEYPYQHVLTMRS